VRRGGRPCGHALALCAGGRSAPLLRRPDHPLGRHLERRCDPRRAGRGRGPRLHRHALPRHARGERARALQGGDPARERRRHRLHGPLFRRERQLPEAQRHRGRLRSAQPAEIGSQENELRHRGRRGKKGLARHLERRPGRGPDRRRGPGRRVVARLESEYGAARQRLQM
jgi:hypothetical protein